jgi:hypothetical protein
MQEQYFALRGDGDAALGALKDGGAELRFQLANLFGEGGLADIAATASTYSRSRREKPASDLGIG